MKVPFFDLGRQSAALKAEILPKLGEVIDITAYSGGKFVEELEAKLAKYVGVKHAIAVNNGTNALHLALLALGVKAGDEVIVPANTFIATAWAPSYIGAVPVFVDCDAKTWNIDPAAVEKAITNKTKAIMGVHLYGQPFDIDALLAVGQKHGIPVIEDNAQAMGATWGGVRVGGFAEISCTSFYPGKNLGAWGEAGAIFTNNDELARHMKMLRNHGCEERYYHEVVGYNARMSGFQGAVLSTKIEHLVAWTARRQEIAARYRNEIITDKITWQHTPQNAESVYHLFVITCNEKDALLAHLTQHQIGFAFHYPVPCHLQNAYKDLGYKVGDMPNSEYLAAHCVSLPMFPEMTDEEVDAVINVLNKF